MDAEWGKAVRAFEKWAALVLGVPVKFDALTAAQIADLGSGCLLSPTRKRPRPDVALPPVTAGSSEDEAERIVQTPMRGVLQSSKGLPPAPKRPRRERSPEEPPAFHPVAEMAGNLPPIAWDTGAIEVLVGSGPAQEKAPAFAGLTLSTDEDDVPYPVGHLEQKTREFLRWCARNQGQHVRRKLIDGEETTYLCPDVVVTERYAVQGVGSARVSTSTVNAIAQAAADSRETIARSGLQRANYIALGATDTPVKLPPYWDVRNLRLLEHPPARIPDGDGEFALFIHAEPVPTRRQLPGDAASIMAVLPQTPATADDRRTLEHLKSTLPVDVTVVRASSADEHPGLSRLGSCVEVVVDTPAGRSPCYVEPRRDFVVTASGHVLGEIGCAVVLGQTIPKHPNLHEYELVEAAKLAYHNAVVQLFYPEPTRPPVRRALAELLRAAPKVLKRANCVAVIEGIAWRRGSRHYLPKLHLGPPTLRTLTRRQQRDLQAVDDFSRCKDSRAYLRPADPRNFGSVVFNYVRGAGYLQIGGMAAASPLSISPLPLPIKAPVQQSSTVGDKAARQRDGNGNLLSRFPLCATKKQEAARALQGTTADKRTIDKSKRIAMAKEKLSGRGLSAKDAEFLMGEVKSLMNNEPQNNVNRWRMIKMCNSQMPEKETQGEIRRLGMEHAVDRWGQYWAAVFQEIMLGGDGTGTEYPRDRRSGVEAAHRLEFCEWSSDPAAVKHVQLRVQWAGREPMVLSSRDDTNWTYNLSPEEKITAIWAVYFRGRIGIKRRVRAEMQADFTRPNLSGCVTMLDAQINELRSRILRLSGFSEANLQKLLR